MVRHGVGKDQQCHNYHHHNYYNDHDNYNNDDHDNYNNDNYNNNDDYNNNNDDYYDYYYTARRPLRQPRRLRLHYRRLLRQPQLLQPLLLQLDHLQGAVEEAVEVVVVLLPRNHAQTGRLFQPNPKVAVRTKAGTVYLTWTNPSDKSIMRYEYRLRDSGSGSWSDWASVPGSHASTTEFELSGVDDKRVCIQLRAVSKNGNGSRSTEYCVNLASPNRSLSSVSAERLALTLLRLLLKLM